MLKATLTANIDAIINRLKATRGNRPKRIGSALSMAAEIVLTKARGYYLTGASLNVVTGRLRASVTKTPPMGAMRIGGAYAVIVGTNVGYGAVHEYGGPVRVPSHVRTISKVFGKPINPVQATIGAHTRNYPARPWLRPSVLVGVAGMRRILQKEVRIFE